MESLQNVNQKLSPIGTSKILEVLSSNNDDYNCNNDYNSFTYMIKDVINLHAPQKKRQILGNQAPFMSSILNKAIMKRSRLRNKFLRTRSSESQKAYNNQRNFCLSLVKKVID